MKNEKAEKLFKAAQRRYLLAYGWKLHPAPKGAPHSKHEYWTPPGRIQWVFPGDRVFLSEAIKAQVREIEDIY